MRGNFHYFTNLNASEKHITSLFYTLCNDVNIIYLDDSLLQNFY